jgi:tRNA A37 N6-isopentenylltransferase MiaA
MSAMKKIAAVVGSSGIGKSKLAVELCKALTGQVINADALQVLWTILPKKSSQLTQCIGV